MGEHERAICQRAVAKILLRSGFTSASPQAIDALERAYSLSNGSVLPTVLQDLSARIHSYSELSTRTKANIEDVFLGLLDVGVNIDELAAYFDFVHHDPLLDPIPQEPPPRPQTHPMFEHDPFVYTDGELTKSQPAYSARNLPPFPNPHTFISSKLVGEPEVPQSQLRAKQADQSRQVEDNLTDFLTKQSRILHPSAATTESQAHRPPDESFEDLLPVNYEHAWRRRRRASSALSSGA
ncbi:transcription initiation factor TFIID subunit 8 [Geranomyces michiganensis]|nr:transcription initiation factor TFIID subunit 8 [Geranomyces michiganensis]